MNPDGGASIHPSSQPAKAGPRMRELQAIVSCMPGISKSEALRRAGLPTRGPGSGRALNRAIAAGMIIAVRVHPTLSQLFDSERSRSRFNLCRELLQAGTTADRVVDLKRQIQAIDAERSATWASC